MPLRPTFDRLARLFLAVICGLTAIGVDVHTGAAYPGRPQAPDTSPSVYLPLLFHYAQPATRIFGIESHQISASRAARMENLGVSWVRTSAFSWAEIEPVRTEPPTYHWEAVDESGLREAAAKGLNLIAIIKHTPAWAQKFPGEYCGPVAAAALDEYAQFVGAVVQRYSQPPYRVKYWEMGNEPDVDPLLLADPYSPFGCWGDNNDPYYGGGYYAAMLQAVYPAIKAADPAAQVIIGGLLLDCDPTQPQACMRSGVLKDRPPKFFEGILRAGGAPYFDIVGFHAYPNFSYATSKIGDLTNTSWQARGGILMGKISFLREVMANYGVSKPLLLTEASLVCYPTSASHCSLWSAPNPFLEAQADYVSWLYVRSWAAGLLGATWYTFEDSDWRYSSLEQDGQTKPVYQAYLFTANELAGAAYAGPVAPGFTGVEGHMFARADRRIWVLWSPDQTDRVVTLPAGVTAVLDKYGQLLPSSDGQIMVNSPVYVELAP